MGKNKLTLKLGDRNELNECENIMIIYIKIKPK
jgi:hypothetical protein